MPIRKYIVTSLLIATVLVIPATFVACAPHRVDDPYYSDTHRWDHQEDERYRQWERETHREHVEFARREEAEQHAYFDWRHSHHD